MLASHSNYPFNSLVARQDSDAVPAAEALVAIPAEQMTELMRLARTVLMKSAQDLDALATAEPQMMAGWIDAFAAHRARADAEARFWSAAVSYLLTASNGQKPVANDE